MGSSYDVMRSCLKYYTNSQNVDHAFCFVTHATPRKHHSIQRQTMEFELHEIF